VKLTRSKNMWLQDNYIPPLKFIATAPKYQQEKKRTRLSDNVFFPYMNLRNQIQLGNQDLKYDASNHTGISNIIEVILKKNNLLRPCNPRKNDPF